MADVVERSLRAYGELLLEVASLGRYERLKGLLQQLSPQARLLSILTLQATLLVLENVYTILGLSLVSHIIALLSRTPVLGLCKDALMLSLPLAILIALPSLVLNPSEDAIPTLDLSVSLDRIEAFLTFLIRVYTATFNMILFTSITSTSSLAVALVSLRIPRPLVVLLALTTINIFIALKSLNIRMLGFRSRFKNESVVELWKAQLRSLALTLVNSEEYTHNLRLSMASRGFTINSYLIKPHGVKAYDVTLLTVLVILALIILLVDRGLLWSPS